MPRLDGALPEVADAPTPLPLPTNRAFVVQLRVQPPGAPLSWEGRVEHVVSGQVVRFHSSEELLAFLARVLTAMQEPRGA